MSWKCFRSNSIKTFFISLISQICWEEPSFLSGKVFTSSVSLQIIVTNFWSLARKKFLEGSKIEGSNEMDLFTKMHRQKCLFILIVRNKLCGTGLVTTYAHFCHSYFSEQKESNKEKRVEEKSNNRKMIRKRKQITKKDRVWIHA